MKGNKIRQIRLALGMTQETFGAAIGVGSITVSRWENGHTSAGSFMAERITKLVDRRYAKTKK